ncbi:MAG: T9SS type A sorting domain-containing protein, partial [Bacteroidales bacterium]|nr:T9SS type A sorting domain-containing protein [Bacteroidales bacterium]
CFIKSDPVWIPLGTSIEEDPFQNLKIYPNPTPGIFTIEMDNSIFGELITRIFSQNATEILNIKFNKTTHHFKAQVDLSGQGQGMYIITFVLDKYKAERKIVVE